jgi:DNA-binding transcriptional LysR family regulator
MPIDLIREFVTVADEGNFTRAAGRLSITQPALSKHMAALEKRVGIQLLRRSNTVTTLTPAGKVFYDDSLRILQDYDTALLHLKDFRSTKPLSLVVESFQGYPPSDRMLAALEADIRRSRKNIELEARDITARSALDEVRDGTADMCLVDYLDGMDLSELTESEPLYQDRFVAIMREDHPLASREAIWISEIGSEVVWTYRSPGVRTYFSAAEQILLSHGANPKFVPLAWTNARQLYNSFSFFEGGIHVNLESVATFWPSMAMSGYRIVRFLDEDASVPMRAVWRTDHSDSPAVEFALESFRAAAARMAPPAQPAGTGSGAASASAGTSTRASAGAPATPSIAANPDAPQLRRE